MWGPNKMLPLVEKEETAGLSVQRQKAIWVHSEKKESDIRRRWPWQHPNLGLQNSKAVKKWVFVV